MLSSPGSKLPARYGAFRTPGSRGKTFVPSASPRTPGTHGHRLPQPFCGGGSTAPTYGFTPHFYYDAPRNQTWLCYEGWAAASRVPRIIMFDHTLKQWSGTYRGTAHNLVSDSHGNPSLVRDNLGFWHMFYGCHLNEAPKHCSTRNINDVTLWGPQRPASAVGAVEYPGCATLGASTMYMLVRHPDNINNAYGIGVATGTVASDGTIVAWSAQTFLVDAGNNARLYFIGPIVVGSTLHFIATLDNFAVSTGQNVYYFIYTPATNTITDIAGGHSISGGSLPVPAANLGNYAAVTMGAATATQAPTWCLDAGGAPHILYGDSAGNSDGSMTIYHTAYFSGWTTKVAIGKLPGFTKGVYTIGARGDGGVIAVWTELADLQFGGMRSAGRSAGVAGTWGTSHKIISTRTPSIIMGCPVSATSSTTHPDIRVAWWENTQTDNDGCAGNGTTHGWCYGDNGFLRIPQSVLAGQHVEFCENLWFTGGWVLSNSNLTITSNTGGVTNNAVVNVGVLQGTGGYFEFIYVKDGGGSPHNGGDAVGVVDMNYQENFLSPYVGRGPESCGYYSDGSVFINNALATTLVTYTTNDNISIAVYNNAAGSWIWFRKNGGLWNNSAGAHPETLAGGIALPTSTHEWLPAVELENNTSVFTLQALPQSWTYASSSGYGYIGEIY